MTPDVCAERRGDQRERRTEGRIAYGAKRSGNFAQGVSSKAIAAVGSLPNGDEERTQEHRRRREAGGRRSSEAARPTGKGRSGSSNRLHRSINSGIGAPAPAARQRLNFHCPMRHLLPVLRDTGHKKRSPRWRAIA
ncbi:hypothetical protein H6F43_03510 [Leptolyngbya sp. FACHB-36]|uniref:hypothetical protein n=1 Tax=Leptolyngbya sp. FACHB-36 TaxID=2692808 RepID=UPI0016807EF0|nr:hypothetical protein [Leptolyngbya sp. FACHB-36]MBD2019249.1 hypothetical protein [Leptolyngbya sp. FACHB-36]